MKNPIIKYGIDILVAYLIVVSSSLLILYLILNQSRILYVLMLFLILIACIFWISTNKYSFDANYFQENANNLLFRLSLILFLILYIIIICVLYWNSSFFSRPLLFYPLISIMVGLIVVEIFSIGKKYNNKLIIILTQIFFIGLAIKLSQELLFPSVVGIDSWFHEFFTKEIIELTYIPEGYGYSTMPSFHNLALTTMVSTGLQYKMSVILVIAFAQLLLDIVLIFLIANIFFNDIRIGLLSSLMVIISNFHIFMSLWSIPNSIGMVFILIVIYLIFSKSKISLYKWSFLLILFSLCLISTHTISSLCLGIFLVELYTFQYLYNIFLAEEKQTKFSIKVPILYNTILFAWWLYISRHYVTLLDLLKDKFAYDYFSKNVPNLAMNYVNNIPISEQILNNMGMFIFFSISIIGVLFMISRKGNNNTFLFACIAITPLIIGFLGEILNVSLIESRWFYFAQVLLSIPFVVAIFHCLSIKTNIRPIFKTTLISLFLISLAFLLIINTQSTVDTNTSLLPSSSVRFALTDSELKAIETINKFSSDEILTDDYYKVTYYKGFKIGSISENLIDKTFIKENTVFAIRNEILQNPFWVGVVYKMHYNLKEVLEVNKISNIYDTSTVQVYYI